MLKVKNIETNYGPIAAVRGVSFIVEAGRIVALLGANGAGKTTVLKTIMGLIDDQPDKGNIEFLGRRIDGQDPAAIVGMGLAFVPEGREVFPELTVEENLNLGAYTRRDRAEIRADLERVMTHFPILKDRRKQWAGTLSGGQQQMLAIGRALMTRPKLLMLDEPSLGLAPILVREIFRIIQTLNQEGTTILLVEQNARQALRVAHAGFVLDGGRIVLAGPATDLVKNEDVQEFYLGVRSPDSVKGYQRWKRKKRWR